MRATLAILLAVPLLAAGCLSDAPENVDAASTDAGANGASASASADANGASASASAGEASASATSGGAPVTTVVPFAEEGSTSTAATVCTPVGFCFGNAMPADGESYFEVDLDGTLTAADLTLTWTPESPATEELILGIVYMDGDAYSWVAVSGASPLSLSESGLSIAAEDVEAVYVNANQCAGAGPVFAFGCVSAEQPFSIEGTLTTTSA